MATLVIKDLRMSVRLDRKAQRNIIAGMGFGWISAYRRGGSNPYGIAINHLQVFNVLLVNPIFNTVNQNQFLNIDASDAVDSAINILVDQGQTGTSQSLPVVA